MDVISSLQFAVSMATCIKHEYYPKVNLGSERIDSFCHYGEIAVGDVFLLRTLEMTIICCFSVFSLSTF